MYNKKKIWLHMYKREKILATIINVPQIYWNLLESIVSCDCINFRMDSLITQHTSILIEKSQSSNTYIKPPVNSNVTSKTRRKCRTCDVRKQFETYFDEKGSERVKCIYHSKSYA